MSRLTKKNVIQETDASTLTFGDEFKDAHSLMLAEVSHLLDTCQASRQAEESAQIASNIDLTGYPSANSFAEGGGNTSLVPPPSICFIKSQEYVKLFTRFTNKEFVREMRQMMLQPRPVYGNTDAVGNSTLMDQSSGGQGATSSTAKGLRMKPLLVEWEMAQISNLCPETTHEARALIPSISQDRIDDFDLQRILDDLHTGLNFQMQRDEEDDDDQVLD